MTNTGVLTQEDLARCCREWQNRLGIAHWDIDVEIVRGVEIDGDRGRIDFTLENEHAVIRVKDIVDHHGYRPFDAEQTLVHELVHILIAHMGEPIVTNGAFDVYREVIVDRLARVLVAMKREAEKNNKPATHEEDNIS